MLVAVLGAADLYICTVVLVWLDGLGFGLSAFRQSPAFAIGNLVRSPTLRIVTSSELTADSGPISSVPFDLLFVHLVIPPSIMAFRPKKMLKKVWNFCWRGTCRAFRISSIMYGTKRHEEIAGGNAILERIWPILDPICKGIRGKYNNASGDARVPSSDRIAFAYRQNGAKWPAFIHLDESGVPKSEADKIRLLRQDRAARKKGRDPKKDYRIVWLPPYWLTRLWALLVVTMVGCGFGLAVTVVVPLLVGRAAMDLVFGEELHDAYNVVCLSVYMFLIQ